MAGNLTVDLKGKVAVITGGANGIGKACAIEFAGSGASVAIMDICEEDMKSVCAEIEKNGGKCSSFFCDVSNVASINEVIGKIKSQFGRIDILVNSAGVNIQQYAVDVTEEAWDKISGINTKGVFFCCQSAGKVMIEQGSGKIINISSQMSEVGFFRRAVYCASKGALKQFTKVLAVEWAKKGITVNCVAPTFINTPLTEPMFKEESFREEVISRIPMGRVGETDDVVGAVLYLASDAANLVTGTTLLVDGGWVAW